MVTVSTTERPQGQREDGRDERDAGPRDTARPEPELVLPDPPAAAEPAGTRPGLAGRRHKTWENRWESGQEGKTDSQQMSVSRGTGWEVFSYLVAGMLAYGGIGWLIGHFTHIQILFPIGMLVGIAISLGWIIFRYGRQ
jgi:hypothetical protein